MIALLAAAALSSQFYSGNTLYEQICGPGGDRLACGTYAAGALDQIVIVDDYMKRPHPFCFIGGETVGQIGDILTKYLVEHPERRGFTASVITLVAMKEAFPCPSK